MSRSAQVCCFTAFSTSDKVELWATMVNLPPEYCTRGATAGAVTVLVLLYGKRWLPLALLVPLVGWSRYVLEHHSPAQIVARAGGRRPPRDGSRSRRVSTPRHEYAP